MKEKRGKYSLSRVGVYYGYHPGSITPTGVFFFIANATLIVSY